MQTLKPARTTRQSNAAGAILQRARDARERFLRRHVEAIYAHLTLHHARFMRVEDLVFAAADAFPGLTPNRAQVALEASRLQRDKDGVELDQGIFLSHVLAGEKSDRCTRGVSRNTVGSTQCAVLIASHARAVLDSSVHLRSRGAQQAHDLISMIPVVV